MQHAQGSAAATDYSAAATDYSAAPASAAPSQALARPESVTNTYSTAGEGALWQQAAAPATSWVPERIDHAAYEQLPRIEVLPATLSSIDLLSDIAASRRAQLRANHGVRGALNKVGFKLGLSPAEQRAEDRRSRIRRQLTTTYQIAVVSVKGGVGRTTTAATLGSTFASLRPDRVVAIDANPDFGDLATRTSRHPYGLTLRDLAQASNLDAFSAVQSFTSINNDDLAVIASPWTTEANEALSGREYATAVEVLRRHYNLLLVDCGTGVLDSATATVLQTSDAVVVVTPATVGGVTGAVATINWLGAHGLQHLIAKSIVSIVHHQPAKPTVDVAAIEKLFATAQRPTCVMPYDEHLAEGGEIDLRLLDKDTGLAYEELAAWLSDSFPGYISGDAGDRGGRR
jgi:MinD-like ATPase involved in chromosome partitioning or flagellar assembly